MRYTKWVTDNLIDMNEEKKKIWKDFWKTFGWSILLVVVIIAIVALTCWHYSTRAASVNGSAISRLTIIKELENESGEAMLDALVTKKIIAQKAAEAGIKIDESEIDETIKALEERISSQGSTLEVALTQQGITLEKFREQITLQKALEKLLADKVTVSDDEVNQYIETTKVSTPEGTSDEDFRAQVKEQLVSQKLGAAAQEWINEQKKNAVIKYFVPYAPEPAAEELPVPTTESAPAGEGSQDQPAPTTN